MTKSVLENPYKDKSSNLLLNMSLIVVYSGMIAWATVLMLANAKLIETTEIRQIVGCVAFPDYCKLITFKEAK